MNDALARFRRWESKVSFLSRTKTETIIQCKTYICKISKERYLSRGAGAATAADIQADGRGGALLASSGTLSVGGLRAGGVGDDGGTEHGDNSEDDGGELHLEKLIGTF